MSYSCTLGWEGSVHTSLPFSRHACPVLCDFTASSGWVSTSRWSRKMAIRAMACKFCECRKRMNEGDGHASVTVLDIEHDGVAAHFTPVANDSYAAVIGGHESGEIDGPHFIVPIHRN